MLHELPSFHFKSTLTFSSMLHIHQGSHHFPGWPSGLPRVHQNRVVPGDSLHGKPLGSAFHLLTYTLTHGSFGKKKIMDSNPHPPKKKCLCLKKKKIWRSENQSRCFKRSVKLQPNYCLLRGAVKHNQSEGLKDTISLFTNCLLVNSKSPPCFKSTNHRAVMNSNWFSMQRCKTKSHRILFLMATVFQLHNKS